MNIRFFNLLFFIFFGINNQLYASHDWYGKIFVDYQSISNDINGNINIQILIDLAFLMCSIKTYFFLFFFLALLFFEPIFLRPLCFFG